MPSYRDRTNLIPCASGISCHRTTPVSSESTGRRGMLHTLARHDRLRVLSAEEKAMRRHLHPDASSGRCKGKAKPECVEICLYTTTRSYLCIHRVRHRLLPGRHLTFIALGTDHKQVRYRFLGDGTCARLCMRMWLVAQFGLTVYGLPT